MIFSCRIGYNLHNVSFDKVVKEIHDLLWFIFYSKSWMALLIVYLQQTISVSILRYNTVDNCDSHSPNDVSSQIK